VIALYIILAACPVLFLGAIALVVVVAIGVGTGNRGELTMPPRNRADALTRRMVGHHNKTK
jgi:hypothetical protein